MQFINTTDAASYNKRAKLSALDYYKYGTDGYPELPGADLNLYQS